MAAGTALIGWPKLSLSQDLLTGASHRMGAASSRAADPVFQGDNASSTPSFQNPAANEFSEKEPLSLQRLKQFARQYNPTLAQAWSQIESERSRALQAGLYPNPVVGYRSSQMGGNDTIGDFQGGFIRQEIVTAGKLELSRQKYQERASAAEFQALAQEYRVMNGVAIQFYRLLGSQDRLEIQRELLKHWEDNLLTVGEMFNVGQATEADIRRAKVQLEQQQLRVQKEKNELALEKERLITLVGTSLPEETVSGNLVEDLAPLKFEEALQRLLDESPELGQARATVRSDQIMVKREKAEPIPNVNVEVSAGRSYFDNGPVYGVHAFVEVPIFDWNQGTIKQAQAELRRQEAQVKLIELQLRRRLAEQFQRYLTALQHVSSYREVILPESEQRYKILLHSHEATRETWPAVLEAQRDFFSHRMEYVDQLVAWQTARAAIDGLLLIDGLQAPQDVLPPGHIDAIPKPR